MSPSPQRKGVADEVAEALRADILTGKYDPGAKLPPERELAKRMGVNRASLRQALKKLEHLGLITIRQGDGTRVTHYMETAGIELVSHLIPLASPASPSILADMLDFRRLYGREVARLAAERATDEDIARLSAIAARAANVADAPAVFQVDFDFYVALTAATRNQVMSLLINTVRSTVKAYTPLLTHLNVSAEEVRTHHQAMISALRKRDPSLAARIADRYLKTGADYVLDLLEQGRLKMLRDAGDAGSGSEGSA
jgi:GntR family transcriptional repressor for pyruvate dehydrogenase complex